MRALSTPNTTGGLNLSRAVPTMVALTMMAVSSGARADFFDAYARASLNYLFSDNPTLRREELVRDSTSYFEGQVTGYAEWANDTQSVDGSFRILRNWYTQRENADLENTNYYLNGSAIQSFELSTFGISGAASSVGVLSDEIGTGSGQPGGGNGNTFRVDDTVTRFNIAPFYLIQLSPKDQIDVRIAYTTTDYELDNTGRAPNKIINGTLSYSRTLNQRLTLGLTLNGSNFRATLQPPLFPGIETRNSNKSVGLSADLAYNWNEMTSLIARFGRTNTTANSQFISDDPDTPEVELEVTETDIKNTLYSIEFNRETPRNTWVIGLSRSIVPNSEGSETTRNTFDFDFRRAMTQRVTGIVRILAYDQEALSSLGQLNATNKYKYLQGTAAIGWSIRRHIDLNASYTYRWNERNNLANTSGNAKSNTIGIGIGYKWE